MRGPPVTFFGVVHTRLGYDHCRRTCPRQLHHLAHTHSVTPLSHSASPHSPQLADPPVRRDLRTPLLDNGGVTRGQCPTCVHLPARFPHPAFPISPCGRGVSLGNPCTYQRLHHKHAPHPPPPRRHSACGGGGGVGGGHMHTGGRGDGKDFGGWERETGVWVRGGGVDGEQRGGGWVG